MAAIVFDLDGTLIDSAPDLHGAAARMLRDEGLPPLDPDTIRRFIGNGVPMLVERIIAVTPLDMADHARLVRAFLAHYAAHPADLTRPYPGVRDALSALLAAGHRLGVCTNKPEAPARRILALLDMAAPFDTVVGGDTLPVRKPDPRPVLAAFAPLGAGPRLYVGDSETDAAAARAAGLPFILFTRGYRKAALSEIAHDRSFERFADLPALLDGMAGEAAARA